VKFRPGINLVFPLVLLSALAPSAHAGGRQQQNRQPKPLASLSATGTVLVNGIVAPAQSTVSVGDSLNTDQGGTATITIDGKGAIKVFPQSQILLIQNSSYVAELSRGTAATNTLSGAPGVALRVGDYVVGPAPDAPEATATIKLEKDGGGLVSCLAGTVQVVSVQGDTSVSLKMGQSTSISTAGQVIAAQATSSSALRDQEIIGPAKRHHRVWLVLGIAGGAAVAAAAVIVTHGGGAAVSPSPTPSPAPSPPPLPLPTPAPTHGHK